jgi:ABC-type transporter Mla MlaB component
MEVDIYPFTKKQQDVSRGKREKRKKVTAPKQKNLNDKNARRYLIQLLNSNFTQDDIHVTCTYKIGHHPGTVEEAETEAKNFIRRVNYLRKKKGPSPIKYILVTELTFKDDQLTRVHHHIVMNGGLERDEVEDLWRRKRQKGQKKGEKIGRINADRLQPDENGLAALASYLTKEPNRKKRWSSSQNLIRPLQAPPNDRKYSKRQLERIAHGLVDNNYWKKKYPGWHITDKDYGIQVSHNDLTGYYIYLRLRKDTG